jgi:oligosaccharyltransferase complex subunit beta
VEEVGGRVSVAEIASFIDAGGNVLVTGGQNLGEAIRDLATEVGFEFDDGGTAVIDHNNWDNKLVSAVD